MRTTHARALGSLVAPLLALGALGCQNVMWYGFDASRTTAVTVLGRCGEQFLVVDGAELPSHDAVSLESLAISDEGRVAYAARDGESWWLHVDRDTVLHASAELRFVAWAGRSAVAVVDADDRHAVLRIARDLGGRAYDWRDGPSFDAIAKDAIVVREGFVGYVGHRGPHAHVVVNDEVGPPFDGIASLHLDRVGRPSYIARRGEEGWVVRHGRPTGPFENVAELVSDAEGDRVVALVRSSEGWRAEDGTWSSDAYDYIGDLRFSPSSALAFRAGRDERDLVVVGDRTLGPYPEVTPGTLAFRGDAAVVFAVKSSDGVRLVDDGVASEPWKAIEEIATDGHDRVGFVARRPDNTFVVVIDGVERGGYAWAGDLALGKRGHDAFVARRLGQELVIANGAEHAFEQIVGGSLRFASDGVTWGALTVIDAQLTLSMSGRRSAPIDLEEVTGEILRRRDPKRADAIVDRWIAHALEAAISTRPSRAR